MSLLSLPYFSTLSHKGHDFRKKKIIAHKMCVSNFFTRFVWNVSHSNKNWARYDQKCISIFMYSTRHSCKGLMKIEIFPTDFQNTLKYQISCKSIQWGPELFHADRQTDVTKLTVTFCSFANATRICVRCRLLSMKTKNKPTKMHKLILD